MYTVIIKYVLKNHQTIVSFRGHSDHILCHFYYSSCSHSFDIVSTTQSFTEIDNYFTITERKIEDTRLTIKSNNY